VLLTASPDSTAGALTGLTPVEDDNVVYVFHFYSPMLFTHQGAEWAQPNLESVRGLIYPPDVRNVDLVKARALISYQASLSDYVRDYVYGRAIRSEIDMAAHWAKSHRVRLIATEFGVYKSAVPPESRIAWFHDVRKALEAQSIGWTVWELHGGFGIASDIETGCKSENTVRAALGLCSNERTTAQDASP
jgi:hypothetical protein